MLEDLLPTLDQEFLNKAGSVPFLVEGVKRSYSEGETGDKPSVHDAHELTYVSHGSVRFILQGRSYLVPEGNGIVIKPGHSHTYLVEEGPAEMIAVYFGFTRPSPDEDIRSPEHGGTSIKARNKNIPISKLSIDEFFAFIGESAAGEGQEGPEHTDPAFMIEGQYRQTIGNIAERILEESRSDDYATDLMMRLLAIEIVLLVARAIKAAWEKSLRIKEGKARELVLIAKEYITANYYRDISVADAANYVFLSQGYFARAFRDEVGMSPMAYLMKCRVDVACELLQHPDLKVSSIATRVGFSSPQRFNSAFRKQMNMPPMEFRRQVLGDQADQETDI